VHVGVHHDPVHDRTHKGGESNQVNPWPGQRVLPLPY
jgi:hypothetical protein